MIEVGQATGVLHGHLAKNARRTSQAELPSCDLRLLQSFTNLA